MPTSVIELRFWNLAPMENGQFRPTTLDLLKYNVQEIAIFQVWDVMTNSLLDAMLCEYPCIDLAFSPSGEYIATCHKDQRAVFIWANKALFLADIEVMPEVPLLYCIKIIFQGYLPNCPVTMPGMSNVDRDKSGSESEDSDEESLTRRVVIDEEEMDTDIVLVKSEIKNEQVNFLSLPAITFDLFNNMFLAGF